MGNVTININPCNGGYVPPNGSPMSYGAPPGDYGGSDAYEKKKKHPILKFLLTIGLIGGGGLLAWKRGGRAVFHKQMAQALEKLSNRKIKSAVRKLYQLPAWILPSAEKTGRFLESIRQYMPDGKKSLIDFAKKCYGNAYHSKLENAAEKVVNSSTGKRHPWSNL